MRLLTGMILALSVAATPCFAEECASMTTLNVSAQSEMKAAPDIATVSTGIVTIAPTANDALKKNSVQMNDVFKALKAAGIKDKDIQTSGITLNPQYVYEKNESPKIKGYQANNNLNVIIHDLKAIGGVLDALVAKGANQINGPNFTIENPDKLLDQARKEAVTKARARADLMAGAAGMKVKRIVSISESSGSSGPIPYPVMARKMEMMASADVSTPVAAGEVNLTANVNIVYELE